MEGKYCGFSSFWHFDPVFLFFGNTLCTRQPLEDVVQVLWEHQLSMRLALRNNMVWKLISNTLMHNTPSEVCTAWQAFWFPWQTDSFCSYHTLAHFQEPKGSRRKPRSSKHPSLPCRAGGWQMRNIFLRLCVQALSEMGDLRETLETVEGRKSFSWCH